MLKRLQNLLLNNKLKRKRGFTLIELMVVVIILGTLMTILFVDFGGQDEEVDPLVHKANKTQIDAAMFKFKAKCGRIPTAIEGLDALVEAPQEIESCAGKSFIKKNRIKHKECGYDYKVDDNGDYQVFWLGADCQEGGEGKNADKALSDF